MILDTQAIMEIIPHRYPFLLVDRIIALEDGQSATGIKNVTFNEPFFMGHFPSNPVMPGVLIIEALAQVGAVSLLNCDPFKGKTAYFAGIKKCKFKRKVIPGDTLTLKVEIIRLRENYGTGKATAWVGDEVACEAELAFMIQ